MKAYEHNIQAFMMSPNNGAALPNLFKTQQDLMHEMNSQLQQKIDRLEFSSIVHNKANSHDFHRLVQELLKAKSLQHF